MQQHRFLSLILLLSIALPFNSLKAGFSDSQELLSKGFSVVWKGMQLTGTIGAAAWFINKVVEVAKAKKDPAVDDAQRLTVLENQVGGLMAIHQDGAPEGSNIANIAQQYGLSLSGLTQQLGEHNTRLGELEDRVGQLLWICRFKELLEKSEGQLDAVENPWQIVASMAGAKERFDNIEHDLAGLAGVVSAIPAPVHAAASSSEGSKAVMARVDELAQAAREMQSRPAGEQLVVGAKEQAPVDPE